MKAIIEWESTTTDANLQLERSKVGPTYTYKDICRKYTLTYEYKDSNNQCTQTKLVDGNLECDTKQVNMVSLVCRFYFFLIAYFTEYINCDSAVPPQCPSTSSTAWKKKVTTSLAQMERS